MNTLAELAGFLVGLAERFGGDVPIYLSGVEGEGHYLTIMAGDDPDDYAEYNLETGRRADRDEDDA